MDCLFELPLSAARELSLRRACQIALLLDRLEDICEREFFPGWLVTLKLDDLPRYATPFFWLNVNRCHAACHNAGLESVIALRYLLMTGLDAFFPVMPDGFFCRLPAGDDPVIVLPRMGVRLPASKSAIRLCRIRRDSLRVENDEGVELTVPLNAVPASARLALLQVGSRDSGRLLPHSHPALFPGSSAADRPICPTNSAEQAARITAALRLIQEVDPRQGEQIENGIKWYASLISPNSETHRPRAVPNLRGVIFLPPAENKWILAEAIVHEYYREVLHARMELEELLTFGDEPRFYSPWRDDPLPLAGLLHSLYVRGGVVEFMRQAEASSCLAAERHALRDRRRLLVEQLRLGYAQAPLEHFTMEGRKLLAGLKAIIDRHETELDLPRGRLPDALLAHLRGWCAAHLDLAVQVRRPVRSDA